jgi:hypothetical protein
VQEQEPSEHDQVDGAGEKLGGSSSGTTKRLPNTRVSLVKQLAALRAFAAAGGAERRPVTNEEAGDLVGLAPATVRLTNPFFVESGLIERAGEGFIASEAVVSYQQATQWEADEPEYELAPVIRETWFAKALSPKLSFGPVNKNEALRVLARESRATEANRQQLSLLLDYLHLAGLIEKDGPAIRADQTRRVQTIQPESIDSAEQVGTPTVVAHDPPTRAASELSTASHPLIRGLFQELPPPGSPWTVEKRDAWLELARVTFRMIYTIDPENAPPSQARRREED